MDLLCNRIYWEDLEYVSQLDVNWELLKNTVVVISGATGLIGSFLTDVLMLQNRKIGLSCKVIALGRNEERARKRFGAYWETEWFRFYACDVAAQIPISEENVDYVIHAASNTHPVAYATDPIGSITTNIIGTKNLLEFAVQRNCRRFMFLSSVEIYGENRGDQLRFDESYCGYLNCNTLRAGYPEGKRAGEALCQAYIRQKNADAVIVRLARIYGPTVLKSDTKALSQFLRKGTDGENIVLKSDGKQYFSYCYVADAVAGILYCMLYGVCGEAYNVADALSDITLKNLAQTIAKKTGTQVVFELPDDLESVGYSKATVAVMSGDKLRKLGWKAHYPIAEGISRTLAVLSALAPM